MDSEAANRNIYFNGFHQDRLARFYFLRGLLPSFLKPDLGYLKWSFPRESDLLPHLRILYARIALFTFFLFSVTLFFTLVVLVITSHTRPVLSRALPWFITIFALILLTYGLKDRFFHINRMIAVTTASGMIAGWFSRTVYNRLKTIKKKRLDLSDRADSNYTGST